MQTNTRFKYLYKTLIKFRQNPNNIILKYFNVDYVAILLLGLIFSLGFWFKFNDLISNIKEYNLTSFFLLSFFILQKNNFLVTNLEKNTFLERFSFSKYKIHLVDNIILLKDSIISTLVFMLPFFIYIISSALLFLLGFILSMIIICTSSVFCTELFKNIILILAKVSPFFYKIKKVLLTALFSILYFLILRYSLQLSDNQLSLFYYFNSGYYFLIDGFNLTTLLVYLALIFGLLTIIFTLIPLINITNYKVKNKKVIKTPSFNENTYQENAIKGITNSLLKKDLNLSEALLDQLLDFIFRFIWLIILFYSSKTFISFNNIIFITSVIIISSLGKELDIILVQTRYKLSNQFKIINNYEDIKILNQFLKQNLTFKIFLFIIPLISLNIFFNNLVYGILISISLVFIFGSSYYFHYLFTKKQFLFSNRYTNDRPISGKILIINLGLFGYLLLMFAKNEIIFISLVIPLIFFLVPFILFIRMLFTLKFSYYPLCEKQNDNYSCGRVALKNLLFYYDIDISITDFSSPKCGDSIYGIILLAKKYNVNLKAYEGVDTNQITSPSIVLIKKHFSNHYVVVIESQKRHFIIIDSLKKRTLAISKTKFKKYFSGIVIK